MKIKNNRKNKKITLIITIFILGALSYILMAYFSHLPPFTQQDVKKEVDPPFGSQKVSLEKSSTEEKAIDDVSKNPDKKLKNPQTDTPKAPSEVDSSNKLGVNVLLTNAGTLNGNVSASGMVTNIVEDGGICTYTFTNGSEKVIKTSTTLTNPTSTTCVTVRFSADELKSSGVWKVQLQYDSDRAAGISGIKEFNK